jgi:hypothetical protein
MVPLALAAAVALLHPSRLDNWRWQIEAADWTWQATAPDRAVEVFTRPVKDSPAPQLWVRTERFEGQWQSQLAKVAFDCRAGQVSVLQAEDFGGMNLSGEVREADASGWSTPTPLLRPILASACGS